MKVTVFSIPVLASSGGFFLVQGEGLHDDVRTARHGARTGPFASTCRALVWTQGSPGTIACLSQRFAVGDRPQKCRANGIGIWRSGRRRYQPKPSPGFAAFPDLFAVGLRPHPAGDPGGI